MSGPAFRRLRGIEMVGTYKYWVAPEFDGSYSVYRKSPTDPVSDSGYLAGNFGSRKAASDYMQREQEFDESDFGKEFNEALEKEDWS
jgi:hypothetical protein